MNTTPGQKSLHHFASSSDNCGPIEAIRNRMIKPDINVECPPEILRDCSAMHLDHKYHQKVFFTRPESNRSLVDINGVYTENGTHYVFRDRLKPQYSL